MITPNGAFAYITNQGSNSVSVIDTATNTVTDTIPVGNNPFGIALQQTQSPQDHIAAAIAQVNALIAGGTLTQNQGAGLIDKLNQVLIKLAANQTGAACNQMSSFINQVNALINNGALTQAQGQALINAANAIKKVSVVSSSSLRAASPATVARN